MKILNKYTYLFLGIVFIGILVLFAIIPNFETQEFNPDKVENISENLSTNTTIYTNNENTLDESPSSTTPVIAEVEKSEIEKLLINNKATFDIDGFNTYLLIGSDERDENSSASRGFADGKRADVIIF